MPSSTLETCQILLLTKYVLVDHIMILKCRSFIFTLSRRYLQPFFALLLGRMTPALYLVFQNAADKGSLCPGTLSLHFSHAISSMEVMAGLSVPSKAPMSCAIEAPGETVVYNRVAKWGGIKLLS